MLTNAVKRKLQTLRDLPAIPTVISQLLRSLDNVDIPASQIAKLIERDQALTSKVLQAANSPFYGFSRRISTVELAVVIMGFNSIKEIVISLVVQKFVKRYSKSLIDINKFWEYSVFCGAASRLLARKLGYRLAGEAFVAGLMHDMGILILIQHFNSEFRKIKVIQEEQKFSLVYSEEIVLGCTHADIGAWLAEKWNLPQQLVEAIQYHHTPYLTAIKLQEDDTKIKLQNKFLDEDLLGSRFGYNSGNNVGTNSENTPKSKFSLDKNNANRISENQKNKLKVNKPQANQITQKSGGVLLTSNKAKVSNNSSLLTKTAKRKKNEAPEESFMNFNEIKQPLTAIVSMAEWFADNLGYKTWSGEKNKSKLFLASDIFEELTQNDFLDTGSAIGKLKQEILLEFERASELNKISVHSIY